MSSGSSRLTREQKRKRFLENPNCHWCGRRMILLSSEMIKYLKNKLPPLACTTDHIRNRFDPKRKIEELRHKELRRVLACKECNEKRGREDWEKYKIENNLESTKGW